MIVPISQAELLEKIACETARMSYPGSMSRGKKPVVAKGAKAELEKYFISKFPMREVWLSASKVAKSYDSWHDARTKEVAAAIQNHVSAHNNSESVAAKFLNTFMHQLMKYEACRPLLPVLHLPLDARVFSALLRLKSPTLNQVRQKLTYSPYALPYVEHKEIQNALASFMQELNRRQNAEFTVQSRIELNWLWL